MKTKRNPTGRKRMPSGVVRLGDLAPRKPVKGSARRLLFGERVDPPDLPEDADAATTREKEGPTK